MILILDSFSCLFRGVPPGVPPAQKGVPPGRKGVPLIGFGCIPGEGYTPGGYTLFLAYLSQKCRGVGVSLESELVGKEKKKKRGDMQGKEGSVKIHYKACNSANKEKGYTAYTSIHPCIENTLIERGAKRCCNL